MSARLPNFRNIIIIFLIFGKKSLKFIVYGFFILLILFLQDTITKIQTSKNNQTSINKIFDFWIFFDFCILFFVSCIFGY